MRTLPFTVGLLMGWLHLVGCGDPAPPPAAPITPEPEAPEAPVVVAPEPPAAAPPVCSEVGSTTEEVIPDAARAANEAAVRQLSAGALAEAEAALASVVASTPGYRMARYNRACALSRLDRADDAWAALLPLLCEELPTFGPRVLADPDLAAVRARPELAATLDAIASLYRTAAEGGVPLVAYTHGPARTDAPGTEWEEAQAGSFAPTTGRFVPMGPRLRQRGTAGASGDGGFALNATRWDPQSGRVLSILARGTDAEDPSFGMVELFVHEAATGRELLTHRQNVGGPSVAARLAPDAMLISYDDIELEPRQLMVDASGAHAAGRTALDPPNLNVGPLSWAYVARPQPVPTRSDVVLPDGRSVAVGPTPRLESRYVRPTSDPDVISIVTYSHGDCGIRDHYVVERMTISTGARMEVARGDGYPILDDALGSLFIQVGATLQYFPDLGAGPASTVRPGLGLSSATNDINPYC